MQIHTSLALLFVLALGVAPLSAAADPAAATGPMSAMTFFVGTWNCSGAMVGKQVGKATVAFEVELDGDLMQQSIDAPAMGKRPAYHSLGSMAYDAKKHRFITAGIDHSGAWGISWTRGWVGNALTWTDIATADGDLGHEVVTKAGAAAYDDVFYAKVKGVQKAIFKAHCIKAASS